MATAEIESLVGSDKLTGRPELLPGKTYKRKIHTVENGQVNVYITICDRDGVPFEIFLNCSDARFSEFAAVMMILASRALRAGVPPRVIAEDLQSIHSPFTSHFRVEHTGQCPSLAAAIGEVILQHAEHASCVPADTR